MYIRRCIRTFSYRRCQSENVDPTLSIWRCQSIVVNPTLSIRCFQPIVVNPMFSTNHFQPILVNLTFSTNRSQYNVVNQSFSTNRFQPIVVNPTLSIWRSQSIVVKPDVVNPVLDLMFEWMLTNRLTGYDVSWRILLDVPSYIGRSSFENEYSIVLKSSRVLIMLPTLLLFSLYHYSFLTIVFVGEYNVH